ncbi:hypothetical protein ACFU7T_03380 [Streptomyces sp. NPDC057555]|uniref:hypothetical protein n=1 Tax=Streptomyces sp. NPDC057555 TaxID=3346166 RepID=UPI0036C85B66
MAPTGDLAKAKEHLARARTKVTRLTYAYAADSPQDDRLAQVLADADVGTVALIRPPRSCARGEVHCGRRRFATVGARIRDGSVVRRTR